MNQITLEGFEQMGTFDLSNKEHLSRLTLLAHTYSNKKGTKKLIELNDRWINEALSQNKNLDPTYFNDLAKNGSVETRIEIAKRNNITSAVLTKLSYDSNSQVLLACAANPKNSAKNSKSSAFAFPSTATAAMRTRTIEPTRLITSECLALVITRTRMIIFS